MVDMDVFSSYQHPVPSRKESLLGTTLVEVLAYGASEMDKRHRRRQTISKIR